MILASLIQLFLHIPPWKWIMLDYWIQEVHTTYIQTYIHGLPAHQKKLCHSWMRYKLSKLIY